MRRGFTLFELALVITIVVATAAVILPALQTCHRCGATRQGQNARQLRQILTAMVSYSDSNGGFYPGLTPDGEGPAAPVEARMWELVSRNLITGEVLNSPFEVKTTWTTGPVTAAHYSYAMLQVPDDGRRRLEWKNTVRTDAIVVSDRNLGTAAKPWSVQESRGWVGHVARNDISVLQLMTHTTSTRYGSVRNQDDHLFEAASGDDAWMVFEGNGESVE